ncbi:MAG TPA: ABC transporter ATP-binding protein [Vicinamibacterales bacterium]|nr:ABC transporter ATP-binding protein [Vicinamibacterales bacterium]
MSPARRLLQHLVPYRRAYVKGFLGVVAATALLLAGPWVTKYAIDDLVADLTAAKLWGYAGAILGLAAVGGWFRFLNRRIIVGVSREFEYSLRNEFFAHLQRLDLGYFQRTRTGDLMSRATNDLTAVRMLMGPAVLYTSSTVLTFVVAVLLMISIDPWLTLVALVPLPCVSIFVNYFGTRIHDRFEQIQAQLSTVSAVTQESLAGVRVVRAYRQEPFELDRFREANAEYVRRNRGLIALQALYFPSMGLLMGIGALLVLWLGSREVLRGRITIGELVAFNAYLAMLAWPMIAFGWVTNLWQRGMASWKRMLEVLDVEPGVADTQVAAGAPASPEAIRGDVEFRHLTFAFGGEPVLKDVSISIPAGTTTAIVGGTGAGKSTLLSLLARLHEPPPGTVFVDGHDVRHLPLTVLRGAIGFVPQELFLFSATIADNITLGEPAAATAVPRWPRDRVDAAAATARLDADLASFPQGYDTVVGERGITLSGGQKQRTALARALVIDPRILVLDDTLSAVDTHTEEEILRRLHSVMRERTSILVSHRVSTVRQADQILVFDDGRVVERGTHDELLRLGGLYAALARHQQLEDELAAIG